MADIREQLLAAFEVEQREHADAMRAALARVRAGDEIDVREIFRRAHSLKGAARAVDMEVIETAAHNLETLFADALESGARLSDSAVTQAMRELDQIEQAVSAAFARAPAQRDEAAATSGAQLSEYLRVDTAQVQRLSSAMYELSTDMSASESWAEKLAEFHARAGALTRALQTAAVKLSDAGARREIAGLAEQSRTLASVIMAAARDQRVLTWAAAQSAGRVREEIERIAMVPAASVFAGLDTMLRELAAENGQEIDVHIEGLSVQAGRRVLQSLRDPVIHLLRNALAHGIESPADRRRAGKATRGEVGLTISSRAGRLNLLVWDDGRGPDLARLEEVAISRGLIFPREEFHPPPPADLLLSFAFEPGISTARSVDRISGRGMGLSVVAEAVSAAGGSVSLRRRYPTGAEITLSTPLSSARQPVLLAREGTQIYGLPTHGVERVVTLASNALELIDGRRVARVDIEGNQVLVPVVSLPNALAGKPGARPEGERMSIAVIRQNELRLGLHAQSFEGVVTGSTVSLGHADGLGLVLGAMQLEHDELALVVNLDGVMQRYARNELDFAVPAPQELARRIRRTILVVDDSLTTRTLEKSILEAQGYRVILSVDGLDGLNALRGAGEPIDVIVADIEMPRMDGFQFLQALKNDAQLSAIPVILMTSRADPEDVRRGLELGADAYLVKQNFDQRELLATIGQLL